MLENNRDNTNVETLDVNVEHLENNGIVVKKKNSKLLIVIGVIVVILFGIGVHYLLTINNPKTIFKKASNSFFESFEKVLYETPDYLEKSYLYEGNVKVNTNIEEYSFLNDEKFNYTFGLDIKNKKAEAGFDIVDGNNNLVVVDTNVKDNNIYVDLNELFDKVILFDDNTIKENTGKSISEFFTELEELYSDENIKDIKYIVSSFKEITNEALEQVSYEKVSVKLDINGKNVSTNKMSLNFNKENMQIIARTYIDGILNDSKLIEEIASLTEYDKTELTEMLNSAKDEINEIEEPDGTLKLSVYTGGILGNVVKVAMEENDLEEAYFINYKNYKLFVIDNMFIEIKDKDLILKEDEEVILTGIVNSLDKNNIDIDFSSADKKSFNGNFKYAFDESNVDFKFNLEVLSDEKIVVNLSTKTTTISDTEKEAKVVLGISYGSKTLEVTNTTKMIVGANIANLNTNNKLNFNDLTENDLNTIEDNLEAKLKGTEYSKLMGMDSKSDFIADANVAIDASERAMNAVAFGTMSSNYTMENAMTYCFTLQNLEDAGYIQGYDDYEGTITITKVGNDYSYRIEMHNGKYYVRTLDVVSDSNIRDYMPNAVKTNCLSSASY